MKANQTTLAELPIDTWIFLAVFAGYAFVYHEALPIASLMFILFFLYFLSDHLLPPALNDRVKTFIVMTCVGIFAIGAGVVYMMSRHLTQPYLFVHDGLIQTEEAIKFLLAGKNPYVENYTDTPMVYWKFQLGDLTENPALYHNPYLPFLFLFLLPFYLASQQLFGWFDGRMVFLPQFIVVLVLLARWVKDKRRRNALFLLIALNPFFTPFLLDGRNDVFVLFWIVVSVAFLQSKRERLAMLTLGFACASKWTAWFILPFYALYLFQPPVSNLGLWLRNRWHTCLGQWVPWLVTVVLILLPFFLWQPSAFIDDVWNYQNGTSQFAPYPISGYGFNILARAAGLLPPDATRSPFEILQWIVGLPLLAVLMWRQVKNNTLPQVWRAYGMLIGTMGFFSHTLNDSHIGFILTVLAIAMFTDEPTTTLTRQVA